MRGLEKLSMEIYGKVREAAAGMEDALILGHALATAAAAAMSDAETTATHLGRGLAAAASPPDPVTTARYIMVGCNLWRDEHLGYNEAGSAMKTRCIDYVEPTTARSAPYLDFGGLGLALVAVERRQRSRWQIRHGYFGGSYANERYLCGRNEAGTYFSHRVRSDICSVLGAIDWIWSEKSCDIVRRQGDVAVIAGNGGPKYPSTGLPESHCIVRDMLSEEEWILHPTHPPIRAPGKGERVIVGRRAAQKIVPQSRD